MPRCSHTSLALSLSLLLGIFGLLRGCVPGHASFGYTARDGPATWKGLCRRGKQQSPINIDFYKLEPADFGPLVFENYVQHGEVEVENNGHTEEVIGFLNWTNVPSVRGGGLQGTYLLNQFHFHWNGNEWAGSEHTFMGIHMPLEVHLVHIRSDLTPETAASVPGGIAVFAVVFMLDEGNSTGEVQRNSTLHELEAVFAQTINASSEVPLHYSPHHMLPHDTTHFLRYNGSLTTPPCTELDSLRMRMSDRGEPLKNNWRYVQPLNDRKVYVSGGTIGSHYHRLEMLPNLTAFHGACIAENDYELVLQVLKDPVKSVLYRPECDRALEEAFDLIQT